MSHVLGTGGAAEADAGSGATAVASASASASGDELAGTPVSGRVPVAGAAVTLISLAGKQLSRAVSDGDGSFGTSAPAAGSYVLIASADGFHPQRQWS